MSTIFDYLKEVTYDSIYDRPFNELDVLALTELTYLPFDRIVPQGDTTNIEVRLSDAAELIDRTTDFIVTDQHLQLVDDLASSKRFKNIKLLNYVNEYDPDVQKQFAAMTYRLTMDVYLVVFRGTDDTLIGWKEDFHMTYMDHVPAQRRAACYLQHVMKEFPKGRFLVAGHSKGGNLATYACTYLPDSLFERVDAIYSHYRDRRLPADVSKHSSLCPSGIHRWHDVGSARTDDHCQKSRLWWFCPARCLYLGNQGLQLCDRF